MENSFAQISELFAQFSENAKLQIEKGNKAAGITGLNTKCGMNEM